MMMMMMMMMMMRAVVQDAQWLSGFDFTRSSVPGVGGKSCLESKLREISKDEEMVN